ncbi:MAG TPA: polyphosphate polymerase domain-containing protein [Patescibacteria group bacterium]|nr:polyphosphate polymerase domain-containing protein [Patescibacteria group bacterium]
MAKPALHFQRFEFKYYLPKNTANKLIPALLSHMSWDPYIKNSSYDFYQVNSLYFDSPNYGCFWDKESGLADRKKLRLRFYNQLSDSESPIFLEVKRKKDALVIKDRIPLELKDAANGVLDSKLSSLAKQNESNDFLKELIWFKKSNSLRPKLFVTYKRQALIGKLDKKFRVTFDYDVKTQLISSLVHPLNKLKEVYPEGVVLELKYNNILPFWFQEIIQKYQLQRLAYSKYCNSLRRVLPQLDDHNYSVI